MKKQIFALLSLFMVMALTACGGDDKNEPKPTASVKPSVSSVEINGMGGQQAITVEASQEWGSYTSAEWLTVTPSSSTSRSTQVTIIAAKNPATTARTGSVTFTCGAARATVTVNQTAGDGSDDPNAIKVPATVVDAAKYKLVWNDEFDQASASLDASKWTHEVQNAGWVNNELQNYVNEKGPDGKRVTEVKNGVLRITCYRGADNKIYSGRVYGNVSKGFQYGYLEARIKLPSGSGTWPAWWMMPVGNDWNTNPWPMCGEIDIMEEVGNHANYVSSSIHTQNYNHTKGTQKTHEFQIATAETEFHTYGVEWTADYLRFIFDGEEHLKVEKSVLGSDHNSWPFHYAFYPILNLAFGGSWGGAQGVNYNILEGNGVTMQVDYVRVFQK